MTRLVSTIIPFYNRFVFLDEAIMCVVRQSYRPIEIILVDDCSEESYSIDPYCGLGISITHIRNPSNFGPATSRFVGLAKAKGEFLDSDDRLGERCVERQVKTMQHLDNPAFVYCFTKLFNRDGIISDRHVAQVAVDQILPDIFLRGASMVYFSVPVEQAGVAADRTIRGLCLAGL